MPATNAKFRPNLTWRIFAQCNPAEALAELRGFAVANQSKKTYCAVCNRCYNKTYLGTHLCSKDHEERLTKLTGASASIPH